MNGKKNRKYDEVLECRGLGLTTREAAAQLGVAHHYVLGVTGIFDAMRKRDYVKCFQVRARYGIADEVIEWAADKLGIPLNEIYSPGQLTEEEPEKKEKKQETAGTAIDYSLYFTKLLENIAQTNELLNQMMDVVIPKYCADLKDNQNINFDMICQSQKRMEDKLEAIKIGVRRKGM